MIRLSRAEIDALFGHYLVANTPGFLYRHMREEPTVQRLAEERSVEELSESIREVNDTEERDASEVALAYACLIALTLKFTKPAEVAINELVCPNLEWLPSIVSLWRMGRVAVSENVESFPRLALDAGSSQTTSSSDDTTIVSPGA